MKQKRIKCGYCGRFRYRKMMEQYKNALWYCRDIVMCESYVAFKKNLKLK